MVYGSGALASGDPPVEPRLAADIRQLLIIEGVVQGFPQIREQAIAAGVEGLRRQGTVSEAGLKEFERRFRLQMDPEPYLDTLVRIYAKHFTDEEIRQIIAFQVSPVGKKLRQQLDALQQEIVMQCEQVGAATGFEIGAQLQKEHPEYFRTGK